MKLAVLIVISVANLAMMMATRQYRIEAVKLAAATRQNVADWNRQIAEAEKKVDEARAEYIKQVDRAAAACTDFARGSRR